MGQSYTGVSVFKNTRAAQKLDLDVVNLNRLTDNLKQIRSSCNWQYFCSQIEDLDGPNKRPTCVRSLFLKSIQNILFNFLQRTDV